MCNSGPCSTKEMYKRVLQYKRAPEVDTMEGNKDDRGLENPFEE